jgi:DNA-binding protein HU-beta
VATATPVAKREQAWRKDWRETGILDKGLNPILSLGLDCLLFGWLWRTVLIKLDIINEVVNRTGITKTKAEMAVETVFESMKRALTQGERIELRGFGIFNVRPRKTGIGRNPRTGAEVAIPPGKAVRFKPGKELQALH